MRQGKDVLSMALNPNTQTTCLMVSTSLHPDKTSRFKGLRLVHRIGAELYLPHTCLLARFFGPRAPPPARRAVPCAGGYGAPSARRPQPPQETTT